MLHAFAKKASPARFRRASTMRFMRAHPKRAGDFREILMLTSANSALRRQRRLVRALNLSAPLSRIWRELAMQRVTSRGDSAENLRSSTVSAKRRFASLPSRAVATYMTQVNLNVHRTLNYALRTERAGLLRRALRRRRRERVFVDLRAAAIHRRAPRERAIRPWKLKRRARARLAARARR